MQQSIDQRLQELIRKKAQFQVLSDSIIADKLAYNDNRYCFTGPSKTKLDNWSPCHLKLQGVDMGTSEQAIFLVGKAGIFGDKETLTLGLSQIWTPKKAKMMGRDVKGFDPETWATESLWISDLVLLMKALQDEECLKELMSTGKRQIAEASRFDKLWGVGCESKNALVKDWPQDGNQLGKSWMRVRDYIQKTLETQRIEPFVDPDQVTRFQSFFLRDSSLTEA
ncbi:hypothetical protein EDD86DRAFT_134090 [Gorgonomyces haynaldii]|nr:hypothetical protein EDD86DRAFT_134090 [Gorgonomyces haynaldii]